MADNITIDNGGLTDYEVRSTDVGGGKHVQHLRIDLDAPYNVKIDEGATYTYIGHAVPGSVTSGGVWRIKRLTNSDATVLWADGDGNFNNVWDDRASLSYS
jgi:hypothetical protein